MFCIKCGRDTKSDRFFCDECLASMAKYPVKPGTPVYLPKHTDPPPAKRSSRRAVSLSPEEQLTRLRRSNRRLRIWMAVLVLLLGAAVFMLVRQLLGTTGPLPTGRNYTIGSSRTQP